MIAENIQPTFKCWLGPFDDYDGETAVFYAYYREGDRTLCPSWSIRMFL